MTMTGKQRAALRAECNRLKPQVHVGQEGLTPALATWLIAGSWVCGDFAVWIGDPQKNRAWELLAAAKTAADRALSNPGLAAPAREAIFEQLAVCEGSDWFWWLGRDNRPEDSVDFDNLFRTHLEALYQLLGEPLPEHIEPIAPPSGKRPVAGASGAMRRAGR
jgi:alpha-amylase/alpha-mannosidase (GH57 family)